MWSMWFSLPAAIWAYFANPDCKAISINWDGWFQLNMQELETIAFHKIPLLIIVVNNNSLWMVREFQDAYFNWRNIWTVIGYSCPDISKIAKAYTLKYYKIWKKTNVKGIFCKALIEKQPTILEIQSSPKSQIVPKVMFGAPLDDQNPVLDKHMKDKITKILI